MTEAVGTAPITFADPGMGNRADWEAQRDFLGNLLTWLEDGQAPTEGPRGNPAGAPNLNAPDIKMSADDLGLILMDLRSKLSEIQIRQGKDDIQHRQQKKESTHNERLEQLQKVIDSMRKKRKSGLFGKVFGWVAVAAAIVAAVAVSVATGGVATPLVVAAALSLTMMILEETDTMDDVVKGLAKGLAPIVGDEHAELMAAITIAVVIIAISMKGGGNSAKLGQILSNPAKSWKFAAAVAGVAAQGTEGAALVGQGTAKGMEANYQYQADNAQANAMDLNAVIQKIQAFLEDEMDRLQEVMEQLESSNSIIIQMIKGGDEASSKILRHIA